VTYSGRILIRLRAGEIRPEVLASYSVRTSPNSFYEKMD